MKQRVGLVGLLETRVKAQNIGALYVRMFSGWCFTSNIAWHKGGRIMVSWNPLIFNVNILWCSSQLIHLEVATTDDRNKFKVIFVYAFNKEDERRALWKDLCALAALEPWLVLGDFNDILSKDERIGTKVKFNSSNEFARCVADCCLEDVKFSGNFFTWTNKQHGDDRIFSKIDRILANQAWLDVFSAAEAVFLSEGMFDHCPGLLTVYQEEFNGKKLFKYFIMWSSFPGFGDRVKCCWNHHRSGTPMYQVVSKLKALKQVLKEINKLGFSNLHTKVESARVELLQSQQKLQADPMNQELHSQELKNREIFAELNKAYGSFLQQKAKMNWAKGGDENTSFYHACIRERKLQSRIYSIINSDGVRVESPS
ncbi:uncharacterized protein LOC133832049 [Humulus lupulus]|uniref:uncharacterized protein LOC133832049 n=1 Tax=Humulus lupulus TaxID=3486 RepID=UPI002B417C80|nr:uncharacterized protein LOC133832049 [Humulus lupulus]